MTTSLPSVARNKPLLALIQAIKFIFSSLLGFFTDYAMYGILSLVLRELGSVAVPMSNVGARIVSAGVNFAVNKRVVFHNHEGVARTGFKYALLAACVLAANTCLLNFAVNTLGVNQYVAKLGTEVTFFTASWLIQKFVVFRSIKC